MDFSWKSPKLATSVCFLPISFSIRTSEGATSSNNRQLTNTTIPTRDKRLKLEKKQDEISSFQTSNHQNETLQLTKSKNLTYPPPLWSHILITKQPNDWMNWDNSLPRSHSSWKEAKETSLRLRDQENQSLSFLTSETKWGERETEYTFNSEGIEMMRVFYSVRKTGT